MTEAQTDSINAAALEFQNAVIGLEIGQSLDTGDLQERVAKLEEAGHTLNSAILARAGSAKPIAANDNAPVRATQFHLPDPATLAEREWLHGRHYIRQYLTATVGAGGGGKSANAVSEVLAMVTGRPLLDPAGASTKPLRVWYVNAEDPQDEIDRRFLAAALHFGVTDEQIGDRLWTDTGRDQEFVIMKQTGREMKVCEPFIGGMISEIKRNEIDVVIVDPFVSTHEVPENDNSAIQRVAKAWLQVANDGNCNVEVIHHVVKGLAEITADSSRGGGALKDKARSVRTINPMTAKEGEKACVDNPADFFRVDFGKANLASRAAGSLWRRFVSVPLMNGRGLVKTGDEIGVVEAWRWPSPDTIAERAAEATAAVVAGVPAELLAGLKVRLENSDYKAHELAKYWAGTVVAEILDIDLEEKGGRDVVKAMLAAWIAAGELEVVTLKDHNRRDADHIKPACAGIK